MAYSVSCPAIITSYRT